MGAANGFVTVRPDTVYGANALTPSSHTVYCQQFVCGGTGTQEVSEIGSWMRSTNGGTTIYSRAIFTDDAVNICPEAMVANSQTPEQTTSNYNGGVMWIDYYTYSTKPQITGGSTYWLGILCDDGNQRQAYDSTGGISITKYSVYPAWPTDGSAWETHTDRDYDISLYAVYTPAAGGLSILPDGIASGQVIGTHKLNRYIVASGIASAQAFGMFKANRYLIPSGVASGQAFGTSKLNRYVTPTGVASEQSLGTLKVNRYVIPTGVASTQSFGVNIISRNIKPMGLASGEFFGTSKLNRYVIPSGISSSEALGTAKIIFVISPTSIASEESFGTHQLNRFVIPSGIASLESIGSHIVSAGVIYLLPSGIASSELLGQSKLNRFILTAGITSGESIGTLNISRWLLPAGIASGEAFGGLSLSRFIVPSGIASTEIFGSHQLNFFILPSGIITAESIGTLIISTGGIQLVLPAGIASTEAFGSLVIPIPFNRDWNELKARIVYLLRNDTILRGLLNKSASPYGVYFIRPPEKPSFPVLTMRFIDEIMDVEKNPQPRTIHVEFKAYSATNSDEILERVEEIINQSVHFTDMIEYKVSNAALDSIGPDDFDVNFNIYTGSHRYVFFADHHQLESWS